MPEFERFFACASCHGPLRFHRPDDGGRMSGWLICARCATASPVFDGFPHFVDAVPAGNDLGRQRLGELKQQLIGPREKYSRFIALASKRPSFDLYAAFQPFNEATRSIHPFVDVLRALLKPGDLIADVWNRTGWSGALLAGLFPEQHVVSFWEGPSNVLGYAGYHYWFAAETRPKNLTIAFADPRKGLPFADGTIALLHGPLGSRMCSFKNL